MFQTLESFFSYWRRRIAEATLAGVHDASQALANGVQQAEIDNETPPDVMLLLDGPKPGKRGAK